MARLQLVAQRCPSLAGEAYSMLGEVGAIRSHCLTADEFQITGGRHIQTSSVRVPSLITTPLPLLLQEIRGSMNTEVFQKHKEP